MVVTSISLPYFEPAPMGPAPQMPGTGSSGSTGSAGSSGSHGSGQATCFKGATFHGDGARPWGIAADLALPCATQNELNEDEARTLVANGVKAVSEGANMPTTLEGVHVFQEAKVMYAPGKAANAGGVAVSGLEMSQNSERISWNHGRLGEMLTDLMEGIHGKCVEYGEKDGHVDYVKGANIAGFKKVADAMLAFGVV